MIPKIIHQTFETTDLPFEMSKATESWKQKNPDYEYRFYTAEDRIAFIKQHFGKDVLDAYFTLVPGAFKADLFRYCALKINGGIYADADMVCIEPLDELIDKDDKFISTIDKPMANKWLTNGFMVAEPNHPVFDLCIEKIVQKCKAKELEFYLDYTGPALLGKCLNNYLGKGIEDDYVEGDNGKGIKLGIHQPGSRNLTFNGKAMILAEYPNKEIGRAHV